MVLKNTELSFRVRNLEERNTELEKYKRELVSAGMGVHYIRLLERSIDSSLLSVERVVGKGKG